MRKTFSQTVHSQTVQGERNLQDQQKTGAIPKKSSTSQRTGFNPQPGATGTGKYCSVHNSRTHSTDECSKVAKVRQKVSMARNTNSSGEAQRPRKGMPD